MNKLFGFFEAIYMWSYFVFVVLLRLFRLISQDRFLELLFGENKSDFAKEDVSFSKIFRNLKG
jgi:hypothetical protein